MAEKGPLLEWNISVLFVCRRASVSSSSPTAPVSLLLCTPSKLAHRNPIESSLTTCREWRTSGHASRTERQCRRRNSTRYAVLLGLMIFFSSLCCMFCSSSGLREDALYDCSSSTHRIAVFPMMFVHSSQRAARMVCSPNKFFIALCTKEGTGNQWP